MAEPVIPMTVLALLVRVRVKVLVLVYVQMHDVVKGRSRMRYGARKEVSYYCPCSRALGLPLAIGAT
eukprot:scaffold283080_cov83-Cyclotella_meneghiniana.AAC.1